MLGIKNTRQALAGWLSWLEHQSVHQNAASLILGQGEMHGRPLIDASLSLLLPFSLKSINISSPIIKKILGSSKDNYVLQKGPEGGDGHFSLSSTA